MTAHPAGAKPPLNVFFQHGMVFVRVAAAAVNDADTREASANGLQQKLFENEPRILEI